MTWRTPLTYMITDEFSPLQGSFDVAQQLAIDFRGVCDKFVGNDGKANDQRIGARSLCLTAVSRAPKARSYTSPGHAPWV